MRVPLSLLDSTYSEPLENYVGLVQTGEMELDSEYKIDRS